MSAQRTGVTAKFRLGDFWVYPKANELRGPNGTTHVEPRVMQVLEYLASRPDEVISREDLIRGVWQETFVNDEVLTNAVRELRKAIGDDPKSPEYIQTFPKKGYRLIASINRVSLGWSWEAWRSPRLSGA